MSSVRTRQIILAAVTSVSLAGCASAGGYHPMPSKPVDLSGSWVLDRAASDDPKPILDKLRPKAARDLPSDDDDTGDDSAPPGGGGQQGGQRGGGRSRRGGQERQPQMAYRNNNDAYTHTTVIRMLQADLARADHLTIRQETDNFSIDYGSAVRSFTPGAVSVVSAAWGVADQSSGWKGKDFVIRVKPQMGVASVERFSLAEDGKHMTEELQLGGGDFPAVKLKRVYDHTDRPVTRSVPMTD